MTSPKGNPQSTDDGRSESANVPANAALKEADAIELAIDSLLLKVNADLSPNVTKRMEENRVKMDEIASNRHKLSIERTNNNGDKKENLLTRRMKEAIAMQSRMIDMSFGSSSNNSQEDEYASVVLLGPGIEVKNSVRPILLPKVEKNFSASREA